MGCEVGTQVMNRELSNHLSELRIEGSSITAVGFSDPCSVCGNKKRRCLQPPTSYRKKVLIVEDESSVDSEDNDPVTTTPPSPSTTFCCCCSGTGRTAATATATPSPARSVSGVSLSPSGSCYEAQSGRGFLAKLNALGSPRSSGLGKRVSAGGGDLGAVVAEKKRVGFGGSPVVDGSGKKTHILGEKSSEKKKASECSSGGKSADKVKVSVSCECGIRHVMFF